MTAPSKLVVTLVLASSLYGCAQRDAGSASESAAPRAGSAVPLSKLAAVAGGAVERVLDTSQVCMVNNHFMGIPQIPVTVEGKTYYGCCPMCKDKLANDPAGRTALDPVSQKPVDKALAVIGKTKTGAALYFESEQNLIAYAQRSTPN